VGTLYGIVVYLWSVGKDVLILWYVRLFFLLRGELWYFFRCRDTVPLMVFEYVLGRVGVGLGLIY